MDDSSLEPAALELDSLAPEYSSERHGTYFAVLKRAIEMQPAVRNIALAGPYGAGKSSILNKVADEFDARVIKISLLTLGVRPEETETPEGANPAADTTSNQIQKEIVKQLLYQQRPSDAPESRFRRISRFRWRRELLVAASAALVAVILLIVAGVDIPGLAAGDTQTVKPPEWIRALAGYLAVAIVISAVVALVRLLVQGRLGVEKVTAGPATITLPARSSSYFDEYLDEIIYFFETNKKCDLVILEDLDRFDDAGIFESLRSLNGLLNSARQLDKRNVRFIYAVRDSVFEKLGRDEARTTSDEARAELVRANRTKFFELIVPVVPFITHKNARDLMFALLVSRGHDISRDLVDLVARHVADMRLIHNIVNEYEVFKRLLLDVSRPVPQLDPERLFAMVVFKNAHMADFEAIRHATSSLDKLYETWRSLVSANLRQLRDNDTTLRKRIENREAEQDFAEELASSLRARIDALSSAPGSGLTSGALHVDGQEIDDHTLRNPDFWRRLLEENGAITLTAHRTTQMYSSPETQSMQLSVDALETLLGRSLDSQRWVASSSTASDRAAMSRNRADADFLRRHTWQQLVNHPQHRYASEQDGNTQTFRQWVEHLLPSRLASDLVSNGYITPYFSLHVSTFYGQLIREDAMTYIMRNIDLGKADPDYPLDAEDIEAILRDQGKSVLGERSMFNVSVLNHLLTTNREDAEKVVNRIAIAGDDEREFLDHYLSEGEAKRELIALLVPLQPTLLAYIVEEAPLEHSERVELLDVAIAHRSDQMTYKITPALRAFLEADSTTFGSLTHPTDTVEPPAAAGQTVRFLVEAGAVLPDVTGLSRSAVAALADTRAYRITSRNLQTLVGSSDIALDVLAMTEGQMYSYAVDRIDEYLAAYQESVETAFTVNDSQTFVAVLNASDTWKPADFEHLISGAHPTCRLQHLQDVPDGAWSSLASTRRIPATFSNVAAYVEWAEGVDADLAVLLSSTDTISDVDPVAERERQSLALAVVNSDGVLSVTRRIKLARSLKTGALPASLIRPVSGPLVGRLLRARLLADDAAAFNERLMVDWPTQEAAIVNSRNFIGLAGPDTLKASYIAPLMRSTKVSVAVQRAILNRMAKFGAVPRGTFQAVADNALASRVVLTASGINTVQSGGASTTSVLKLLAGANGRITVDELRQTLRNLGKPYSVIADKSKRRPKLDDTPALRTILERLEDAKIVARSQPEGLSHLRVFLH